jgi:hypothetical protein
MNDERLYIEETGKPPRGWYRDGKPRWDSKHIDRAVLEAKKAQFNRKVAAFKKWRTDRANGAKAAIDRAWRGAKGKAGYAKWRLQNSRAIQGAATVSVLSVLYMMFSGSKPTAQGTTLQIANSALEGVSQQAPMAPEIVARANAVKNTIGQIMPQLDAETQKSLGTYPAMLDQIVAVTQPVVAAKLDLGNPQSAAGYMTAVKTADRSLEKFFQPLQNLQAFLNQKGQAQGAQEVGALITSVADFENTLNDARGVMV